MMSPAGTLFVIATPIGHRGDISERALKTLREVDLIAAEDTRNSGLLLAHFGIRTPMTALHEHNERRTSPLLIEKMQSGASIGLITDAGTPGISDPGALLVDAAFSAGVRVVPVPGPSALTALLSITGFGPTPVLFYGFLPPKSGQRVQVLEKLRPQEATLVFYEAPHRIEACMEAMIRVLGTDRRVVIGRELTKLFETVYRTTLGESLPWLASDPNRRRGEFVLAVEGAPPSEQPDLSSCDRLLQALMEKLSVGDAVRVASEATGLRRKALYDRALQLAERR